MTKPTTEELKELLGKVTQGEWVAAATSDLMLWVTVDHADGDVTASLDSVNPNDATLIAIAPTLAADVVRLREALERISNYPIPRPYFGKGGAIIPDAMRTIARQALSQK